MRLRSLGALCAAVMSMAAFAAPAPPDAAASASGALSTPHGAGAGHASMPALHGRPAVVDHYVDLNSASREELMTLPGIGAAEAGRIIAKRPYLTKNELVTKDVLLVGPFLSVKHLVVAMPKTMTQGKK